MGMFEGLKIFKQGQTPPETQKPVPSLPEVPGARKGVEDYSDRNYASGGANVNPTLSETGPIEAPGTLGKSLEEDRERRLREARKKALGQE